jgi:geranylgeranyl diphosphate synthase type I
VSLEAFGKWSENDVLALHRAKTAIYTYENPLLAGTYLAGLDGKVRDVLRDYSRDGGVAFQLQDDILGVYGDPAKTGKSADSDLKQGKCTLLVLKVLESGTETQKQVLKRVWGNAGATREELDAAKEAIQESGSYEYSKKLAQKLAANAAKTVGELRDFGLDSEAIDYVQGIAEYMVGREV